VTRYLVLVLLLVLARFIEMRTGWPDPVVLPLSALGGLMLLEALATPRDARLDATGWAISAVTALAVATLLFLVAR
jgi:hypothetical protein